MTKRKRKRSNNKRKIVFGLVVGTMIMTIFITACLYISLAFMFYNPYSHCFGSPFPSLSDVETDAYFKLPASATQLEHHSRGKNRGCVLWVSFFISPDDVIPLLDSTLVPLLKPQKAEDRIYNLRFDEIGWTQPEQSISGYGYTSYNIGGEDFKQWIVIETEDPKLYKVYIIVDKGWI